MVMEHVLRLPRLVVFSYLKLAAEVADGTRSVTDVEISSRKSDRAVSLPLRMRVSSSEWSLFYIAHLQRKPANNFFHVLYLPELEIRGMSEILAYSSHMRFSRR